MSKIDRALYNSALECLLTDFDGFCTISDFGIIANGAKIDHLMVVDDPTATIKFYSGDEPTDEYGYYVEIVLTDEEINGVLDQFLDLI